MHYLIAVPELEEDANPPRDEEDLKRVAREAAEKAFDAKLAALDTVKDESGAGYSDRLLSLVALNVIDEKWKDHLYDLDQLRNTIYYRAWGQKDPLVEYKGEAYTMFQGLMADISNAFAERFLRVQLVFEQPPAPLPAAATQHSGQTPAPPSPPPPVCWRETSSPLQSPPPG